MTERPNNLASPQRIPLAATRPLRLSGLSHPQFAGDVSAELRPLPVEDDELATSITIGEMARLAGEDSSSPPVRQAAAAIAALAVDRSPRGLAAAVHSWIRGRVRFQPDDVTAAPISSAPEFAEVLIRPADLLRMRQPAGDCDDFSMLCAALLQALGVGAAFKTVAADRRQPARYSHVYVLAATPQGTLPVDCSHGPHAGWEVRPQGKSRTWRIEPPMNGLGIAAGSPWMNLLNTAASAGADIARARFGQPPPGTYIQRGNDVTIRNPDAPGAGFAFTPGLTSGGSTNTLLLVGAVVVVVSLMGRRS